MSVLYQAGRGSRNWLRENPELVPELAEATASLMFFGGKLLPALSLAAKVSHSMDDLQLLLNGGGDVHVIWDVDISNVSACYEEVIQFNLMPPTVCVGDLSQADVHESIDIVNSSVGHTLIP